MKQYIEEAQIRLAGYSEQPPHASLALARVLLASQFVQQQLDQSPELLPWLLEVTAQANYQVRTDWAGWLQAFPEPDEAQFMRLLRQWRNRQQARLIWHEALAERSLVERLLDISTVADVAIQAAVTYATEVLSERHGHPVAYLNQPQQLIVLGMGKLGALELNISSDIDLIFAFSSDGQCTGDSGLSHSEYFTRLGRKVIQYLDQRTAEGFVYRVDMRLRPNGQSGPLALSVPATLSYYQEQGRDWERYALIKARPITGQTAAAIDLMPGLHDFVFRRYVDYQVLSALRDMKQMIRAENRRLQRQHNIKLGAGGIRDVEFIVQAVQLIQGGQNPDLTQPNIFQAATAIAAQGLLPAAVIEELMQSYTQLRQLEHLLQAQEDRQTQTLPTDANWQARLANVLGHSDWAAAQVDIERCQQRVQRHFDAFIALPKATADATETWQTLVLTSELAPWQDAFGADAHAVQLGVVALHEEWQRHHVSEIGLARMQELLPGLLSELSRLQNPGQVWPRLAAVLKAIIRRSAYVVMLQEHPNAWRHLLRLLALSPWVAEQLAAQPYLLDTLTDPDQLYRLPDRRVLKDDLQQRLLRLPDDDLEQQMEQLRHFRHSRVLRAAACELTGNLPLMKISDYLTHIAEEVLQQVFWLAWFQMVNKYGVPTRADASPCDPDFALIAYGKLGGIELSYASDLDLVFVHDGDPQGQTQGAKPVDNTVFFMRLGQRILHLLSTQTPSGILYETDMRLRPSGNSGLLVTTCAGLASYLRDDAWTWELQALVRARTVAGCPHLRLRIEQVRATELQQPREASVLRSEVLAMRTKMRANLGTPDAQKTQRFHIKQDLGGMVDIEFLVQYLVLRDGHRLPQLTQWSDNIRLLETLHRVGSLTDRQHLALREAYIAWRQEIHRQTLAQGSGQLEGPAALAEFAPVMAQVQAVWIAIMLDSEVAASDAS